MRLLMFDLDGVATLGLRQGDQIINLAKADSTLPKTLKEVIERDALGACEKAGKSAGTDCTLDSADLKSLPPISNPSKILCLGLNYADHAKEGGHAKPQYPSFFMRGPSSLVAHNQAIIRPKVSETLDYEAELMAIVGKRARNVGRKEALDVIVGYSVFNDASVRQYQRLTSQWTIGKNFDATGGFGPEFVTADEVSAGATGLRIQTRLNGETLQDANTDDMLFNVEETIVLLTECMTLEPGDLIAMGTPSGVGHARSPQLWMRDGDVCEIDIEGIGILRNPIRDQA